MDKKLFEFILFFAKYRPNFEFEIFSTKKLKKIEENIYHNKKINMGDETIVVYTILKLLINSAVKEDFSSLIILNNYPNIIDKYFEKKQLNSFEDISFFAVENLFRTFDWLMQWNPEELTSVINFCNYYEENDFSFEQFKNGRVV